MKKNNIDHKTGLKQVPGARNLMIFGPIACFRRPESRFSGQNGPRSSEMMFYLEITGSIKNHKNFKFLFWSGESEKMIFTIFTEKFYEKMGWKYGITSETTIPEISSETTIPGSASELSDFPLQSLFYIWRLFIWRGKELQNPPRRFLYFAIIFFAAASFEKTPCRILNFAIVYFTAALF